MKQLLIILFAFLMLHQAQGQQGTTFPQYNKLDNGFSTASMRKLTNQMVISTKTFYLNDKGKEGFFQYDPTDTTSPDNVGMVIVTNQGKRLKRVYETTINVRWFGAKGDGTTDDTEAFQKAINFRLSIGGDIFIPNGTYLIKNTLTIGDTKGISIIGQSEQDAIVRFKYDTDTTNLDKELFYLSPNSSYCRFETFSVFAARPGKTVAFKAKDQSSPQDIRPNWKIYFHNMRIAGFKTGYWAATDTPLIGANHGFLDGVTFNNCKFRNCRVSYFNQNSQAVNINFFNTDSENDDLGEAYTHILDEAGFTLNIFGGSWIGRGKIYEGNYSASGSGLFAGGNINFIGTRFEVRSGVVGDLLTLPKKLSTVLLSINMSGCSFNGFGQTVSFVGYTGKANVSLSDCNAVAGTFVVNQYPTSGLSGADATGGMHSYGSVHIRRSRGFTYARNETTAFGTFQRDHTSVVRIEQTAVGSSGQFTLDAQSFMSLLSPELAQRGAGLGTTSSNLLIYNSDNPFRGFKSLKFKLPYYSTPMSLVLFKHPAAYAEAIAYKLYFVKDNADWVDPLNFNVVTDGILIADSGSTANKAGYIEFPISWTNTYLNAGSYFQSGFGKWLEGRLYLEHSGSANNFQGFVGVKYL